MANSKQRKKRMRMKRQLQKRLKQTIVKPIEPPKEYKAHLLYPGKYKVENQTYQAQLDKRYFGKVQPIERFVNQNAILLHKCSECFLKFYSRPQWLLFKEDQLHVCYASSIPTGENRRYNRIITAQDIAKMILLAEQGMSRSKIAIEVGASRPTVIKYLKQAGVK
ncbi:helix-turn-helix domain-containing protein [Peribacillus frigoritolerans]|uniref:Helix-turn-helix domain-containing protein n=1 Tax=Peribacillus frigoritolerans TaxID=450367 RepID=A0AAJ1QJQ3_9BACI|nr:helix-turn-helix domain-containing protein [Peribacillus frigoritolerans]MDM5282671.1 helix-turn-helix domain-containing protein [Peribacillus frigoritolerans]